LGQVKRERNASPRRPLLRTDPAGVKKQLDEQLAEAERQARVLQASPSGEGSSVFPYLRTTGQNLSG
jgi:hypothetical protein